MPVMRAVIQRVARAAVQVDGRTVGAIERGLLVLLGIHTDDTAAASDWLIKKLLALRIFADDDGKLNRSVTEVGGGLLVVSQFTLYGDARKGNRPSFIAAMPPAAAERFYGDFMARLRAATALRVAEGKFAALMDVELVNDGPVTIVLEDPKVAQASSLCGTKAGVPSEKKPGAGPVSAGGFVPLDSAKGIGISNRELPHWRQDGVTYFTTFRLADAVPAELLRQWHRERQTWYRAHPSPLSESEQADLHDRFTERFQAWLDAASGECWLRRPEIARIVVAALRHFDGERYQLGRFVVMPSHVHALVTPVGEHELPGILHSWKSFSAQQANSILKRRGRFWQDESFDHIVRNEGALRKFEEYIDWNPVGARLGEGEYMLG